MIRKAIEIAERTQGEEHPDTLKAYLALVDNLYRQRGKKSELKSGDNKRIDISDELNSVYDLIWEERVVSQFDCGRASAATRFSIVACIEASSIILAMSAISMSLSVRPAAIAGVTL